MGNTLQNYEELRDNNKLKEGLKTATEIELPVLMRVFSKLAYLLPFFISLQNGVFSNSKVETFFIAEK